MDLTESIWIAMAALIVEAVIGYPDWLFRAIGHPVTWIGRLIDFGERRLNNPDLPGETRRARGFGFMAVLLLFVGWLAFAIDSWTAPRTLVGLAVVILCASTLIAQRSLDRHVRDVADALDVSLEAGRTAVARIVGRDVSALDETGVARAAIESLAENFSDGVVAPTFWLALLGLPGAALYKTINTADSMIGHKTKRYASFGYAAAKIDDVVNWPAARYAGALLVVSAVFGRHTYARQAWLIMKRDASLHLSPNAGWPEAAMAGALGVRLGGPRNYGGANVAGAWLGSGGETVDRTTIRRALSLYRRALVLQFLALAFCGVALL